jgi:hypothetical protein
VFSDGGLTLPVLVTLNTGLVEVFEKQLDFDVFIPISGVHLPLRVCAVILLYVRSKDEIPISPETIIIRANFMHNL